MAKWQRYRVDLGDEKLTPSQRKRVGEEVIINITEKAINENRGFDTNTGRYRKFPKYTKDYSKQTGKPLSKVDLILSGDMFGELQVQSNRPDAVIVGFQKGSTQNAKAEGNQIGSYGQPSGNSAKARPFLGISKKDLDLIITKVKMNG